ncbi:Golgi-associated plant pathogenesis-related protein 1-like [Adelges cooleyi]|uniref:Golgi-associated plant pathogenesis-related protein 1-like n=1 Tax=Adelges cooleyi TaxID=133065 RepID=UPI00217F7308|nr:Golgi-associated plant pathogenesis-related protein 1-like [Adelges cooleyi]
MTSQDDEIKKCINVSLTRHNFYRKKHQVPPLQISDKLNAISQEWANHLAKEDKCYHRPNSSYGENIFCYFNSEGSDTLQDLSQTAVDSWYDEIKYFKFDWKEKDMGDANKSHHFTQTIWKASKELGTGAAKSEKGVVYFVCNYNPAGNVLGQFAENINNSSEK